MNKYGTLREKKGNSLIQFPDNYVIIDIETTGFSPRNCEIIEIGAVKVRDNKIISVFQMLIKPKNPISSYISNLTGITNNMLIDANPIATVLDAFVSFAGNNILIGHKVNSDVNFLYDHCKTNIDYDLTNDFIDIRELFRERQRSVLNSQLTSLCEKCAIQNTNAHRALSDCLMANNLYQALKFHNGSIACVEELDSLILASEFNHKYSPYKKKCEHLSPRTERYTRVFL
ncbi:PolC-type DNA polymerase III [Acetobacterium sp.]|uniref:3'-5' exonuclease n=1 Tax=Acetobacterium sp. TaxID=1872094 RepID=UPI0035938123